ncbi:Response regulator receiver domain protein [compost metagenome]
MFSVSVPRGNALVTHATGKPAVMEEPQVDSLLAGCRVWCIDDDTRVSQATRLLLERWACRVAFSGNAEQALAAAADGNAPDLLLLDVRLGATTGPELFPLLAQRWGQEPVVILFTAEQDEALRVLARERGWGFLSKQARTSALRSLMTHLYQRSR